MNGLTLLLGVALGAASPAEPRPRVPEGGPALEFDFPGFSIGVAEYDEGPTGGTVFLFDTPVFAAVDVRGGAPGTVNTDALRLSYGEPAPPFVNAITLAGGSSYGLAFATGVATALGDAVEGPGRWQNIPTVPGAIIFDLASRRLTSVTPDAALARAAVAAARPGWFPLGPRGAGRFAMQGGILGPAAHSGQGGAFRQVGAVKIAVFTVVNAGGAVVDRQGRVVRCRAQEIRGGDCGSVSERLTHHIAEVKARVAAAPAAGPTLNTTISLVVVNQKLPVWALERLAVQVHTSMARAIQPYSTWDDGDTLFAVTTSAVDAPELSPTDLGIIAGEVAWDAVLASVPPLEQNPPETPVALAPADLDRFSGTYDLSPDDHVVVTRAGETLQIQSLTESTRYVAREAPYTLIPMGGAVFVVDSPRRDRLRFDVGAGGDVTGFTISPGSWPVPARRAAPPPPP